MYCIICSCFLLSTCFIIAL